MSPGRLFRLVALLFVGCLALGRPVFPGGQTLEIWLRGQDSEAVPSGVILLLGPDGAALEGAKTEQGSLLFRQVGERVTVQVTCRGLKADSLDLALERAPWIDLVLRVDPSTGKILEATQKSIDQDPVAAGLPGKGKWFTRTPLYPAQGRRVKPSVGIVPDQAPINDSCFNAIEVFDGLTPFDTNGATTDGPDHPGLCQFDGTTPNDIWFRYQATCDGTVVMSTCLRAFDDTDLVIYPGDADGDGDEDAQDCSLVLDGAVLPLTCNDDADDCGSEAAIELPTSAGDHFLIRLGGPFPSDGNLEIHCAPPPFNDDCVNAFDVSCNTTVVIDNSGATTNDSDPLFGCVLFQPPIHAAGSFWLRFVAEGTNVQLFTGDAVQGFGILGLYAGECGHLIELDCDDDTGFFEGICYPDLIPGDTYYVQVATNAGTRGQVTVNIQCPGLCRTPPGDTCADAPFLGCNGSVFIDNFGAHNDSTDPPFACRVGGPSPGVGTVWRRFLATSTSAKISLNGTATLFDTLLAVYSGTCGNLTQLACSDDEGFSRLSELAVDGLTVGDTYYIEVASIDRTELGHLALSLQCPNPAPPNDTCAGAIDLGPLPASTEVNVRRAITDTVFCGTLVPNQRNVWYRVTGTGNVLTATVCDERTTLRESQINVFCGGCDALQCVAGARSTSCGLGSPLFAKATVSWCTQAGASYLLTVGTTRDESGGGGDIVHLEVLDTGEACTAEVACLPRGACCLGNGTCTDRTAAQCAALGGVYRGDGTSCTIEAVTDGGFEVGPLAGHWFESSTNFDTIVCEIPRCGRGGGTGPHGGRFWAWFGGAFAFEEGSLEQDVVLPIGTASLDFQLGIPVSSGNGVDFLRVLVDGVTLFEVHEGDPVWSGQGYQLVSLPLQGFADGRSHRLRFESTITGEDDQGELLLSNFFVDDVSIRSPGSACTFVLDFEHEDDFATPLANGQTLSTPPEFGRLVSITSSGANAGAAIFDSTPGGPNDPPINDDMLIGHGNVLLLQDNRYSAQSVPGFWNAVTDDPQGGDIVLGFAAPVAPVSVLLADIDPPPNLGASVTLFDEFGRTRVYAIEPGWTGTYGNAGPHRLDLTTLAPQAGNGTPRWATATETPGFMAERVARIVVHLTGFGAIDELVFNR